MLKLEIDPMGDGYKIDPELVVTLPYGVVVTFTSFEREGTSYTHTIEVYNNEDDHKHGRPHRMFSV